MEKLKIKLTSIVVSVFGLFTLTSSAQNSDCNTAISVCNNSYNEQNAPMGTGNVMEVGPGSCQTGGEFNSSWYVFTVQEDGMLSFLLAPNAAMDDYDWSLFDITDNGCGGINSGMSPEVSCNSYGSLFGNSGPTGISTANGGIGNSNGPGDLAGPPFNADLPVQQGEVYALVVMNWSGSTDGYTLNFTNNSTSIFDNIAPTLVSATNKWCEGKIELTFSESVDFTGITADDFGFVQPGYEVTSMTISGSSNLANHVILTINGGAFTEDVSLDLVLNNNEVLADMCGNIVAMPLHLELQGEFDYQVTTTNACNGSGATLDIDIPNSTSTDIFTFLINGIAQNAFPMQNAPTGSVSISITDINGCTKTSSASIVNEVATLTMPEDTVLCSLSTTLNAVYVGSSFQWQPQSGLTFSAPSLPTTIVMSNDAFQTDIMAVVQTGSCIVSDAVTVTFNFPPATNTSIEHATCYNACDGRIEVENLNNNVISIFIDANKVVTGQSPVLDQVCAGTHQLTIQHSPQCTSVQTVVVTQPQEVIANFTVSSNKVSVEEPLVTLTSTSINALSLKWQLKGSGVVLSGAESWVIELPSVPGVYEIELIAIGINGCMDKHTIAVTVESDFFFFIPTAFTPNRDGINDVLQITCSSEPEQFEWNIFNRKGEIVFTAHDTSTAWTGNYKATGEYFCPDGMYTWRIIAKGRGQIEPKEYSGHIYLIR